MASTPASVILIEFNELTPKLIDKFIGSGHLPNFQRFYRESLVYVTDAEEEGNNLNPWVQWVTVHSSLSAQEHGITELSEGHKLQTKAVWDILSETGLRVFVCGSMNARYDKPLNGCLLPDPWSTGLSSFPEGEFDSYYKFVRFAVQEHTNQAASPSKLDVFKFLTYMATHGLSFHTTSFILKQIWTEKTTRKFHWKRAAVLDRLQWDIFAHYYRRLRPDFSTFFLNSTAHFQHAYWRDMEPEIFSVKPTDGDRSEYRDAILYGYQNMDDLLGRILRLAGPETTLIFCTGLSQQPYLKYESAGGRHYYRLKAPGLLTSRLGIEGKFTYHPVMAEQFCLRFETPEDAVKAGETLNRYRVGDQNAFYSERHDSDLMVQCNQTRALPPDTLITEGDRSFPFSEIFYEMGELKSGYHHPDGLLWVRRPDRQHRVFEEKVSLRSIAPAILELFEVPRPEYMVCEPFTRQGWREAGSLPPMLLSETSA